LSILFAQSLDTIGVNDPLIPDLLRGQSTELDELVHSASIHIEPLGCFRSGYHIHANNTKGLPSNV
jgi:hypothetical protein